MPTLMMNDCRLVWHESQTTWQKTATRNNNCQQLVWTKRNDREPANRHQAIVLGNTDYEFSFPLQNSIDSLGVSIDNNLSFYYHISKICDKVNHQFSVLKRFWTVRILAFSSYDTSADLLLEQLNWKRLDTQRQIQVATMVYKSIHGLAPDYLGSLFTKYNPPYNLRNSENKLAVPLPRTNFLKNSFSYNGAVIWNSLSPELRQAKSLKSFRNGCRHFFDWIDKTYTASM